MEKLADCYSKLLSQTAGDESVSFILLESLWPQLVGKEVALSSCPQELHDGNLTVLVTDPAWAKALKGMTGVLKKTINTFWGADLVLRVTLTLDEGRKVTSHSSMTS